MQTKTIEAEPARRRTDGLWGGAAMRAKAQAQTGGTADAAAAAAGYRLDAQVGYLLRLASQRHLSIFARALDDLTPTQFAALARLAEAGPQSQNALGRATAMDAATIKGVIHRLQARGLVEARPDAADRRRLTVALTGPGRTRFDAAVAKALAISAETLAPLGPEEQRLFLALLARLG